MKDYSKIFRNILDLPDKSQHNEPLRTVKEAVEKWMVMVGCVSEETLKEFFEEAYLSTFQRIGVDQLLPQYKLTLHCLKLNLDINFSIRSVHFKYFDIDGSYKLGNFYVPHFYFYDYIDHTRSVIGHYPNQFCFGENKIKDTTYLSLPLSKKDEDKIINILSNLPYEKKNIHIGFLTENSKSDGVKFTKYQTLIERLNLLGYDTYGNHEEDFCLTEFGWDDSASTTITVLVEFISSGNSIEIQTERFLSFDNNFTMTYMPGRLVYISIFQEFCIERNKRNNTKRLFGISLAHLHSEWLAIPNYPFFLFPIYIYYPQGSSVATDYDKKIQKFIWNFKDGGLTNGIKDSNSSVLEECVEMVKSILICTFGEEECKKLTLICVPPSSKLRYIKRYRKFSEILESKLGINNGFEYIHFISDVTPKHLGGSGKPTVSISSQIEGKNVIVFDDVYTTGNTIHQFCKLISEKGANVLGAIVLGITQHKKNFENDICNGHQGLFSFYNTDIW